MNRPTQLRQLSGGAMVLGFIVLVPGALLYLTRPQSASPARLVTERAFIMAAVVLTAMGLVLLKEYVIDSLAHAWAVIGAYLYLFGAILIVTAEALGLSGSESTHTLVVTYVVLALLGQVAVGIAIVHSDSLPSILGWATIVWNVIWLIHLPWARPSQVYIPVLHHLMPLAIGSALILAGRDSGASA
jgi:hypothetical protein